MDGFIKICCLYAVLVCQQRLCIKVFFDEIGMLDEFFPACEDHDFWLRSASRFEFKLIPEALTLKDGGRQDELSVNVWGLDRFRIKALAKMLESGVLDDENRLATMEVLAEKCRIFARGAAKRGREEEADKYLNLKEKY